LFSFFVGSFLCCLVRLLLFSFILSLFSFFPSFRVSFYLSVLFACLFFSFFLFCLCDSFCFFLY
jgi:hypothetical protein